MPGKKLYSLPPEHRDTVTSLAFTPQGTLVTAAKDRTLKVWKLGVNGGAVIRTVEHRNGVVGLARRQPGRRADAVRSGQGAYRPRQRRRRADHRTTRQRRPERRVRDTRDVRPGPRRRRRSVHDRDGRRRRRPEGWASGLAGAEAGGRSAEIARLITPGRVAVTCAAFSPHKDDARSSWSARRPERFTSGRSRARTAKKLEGRITFIDATDPRYVTVRVEMSNKEFPLLDHSTATVIVNPEQK